MLFSSNDYYECNNGRCCLEYDDDDDDECDHTAAAAAEKGGQQHHVYRRGAANRAAGAGRHCRLYLVCNTYLVTIIAAGFTAKLRPNPIYTSLANSSLTQP